MLLEDVIGASGLGESSPKSEMERLIQEKVIVVNSSFSESQYEACRSHSIVIRCPVRRCNDIIIPDRRRPELNEEEAKRYLERIISHFNQHDCLDFEAPTIETDSASSDDFCLICEKNHQDGAKSLTRVRIEVRMKK